ncbi:hypothetical protein ACQKNC_21550 [Lysinibacillus sp. NPDC094177]|uniref:hypothetical protein n=1 Tax=Lysinibacillus sp. NPDC094177 TaxID=3390580 RepID=UPI003D066F3E
MDEFEIYYSYIEDTARMKNWKIEDLVIYLNDEMKNNIQLKDIIIPFREDLLTDTEKDKNGLYYYLRELIDGEENTKLVICAIAKEISSKSRELHAIKAFEPYHPQQTVFNMYPELLDELRIKSNKKKDYELIKLNAINFNPMPDSPKYRHCKYKNHFLFIDSYLDSRIPRYLIDKYGPDEIYIRIEPYVVSDAAPPMSLEEEFLRPPNPKWAQILRIYPGNSEGCEVFLPEPIEGDTIGDDPKKKRQWWEYEVSKLRKLEINAGMKNENNKKHFSMSLEELSEESLSEGKLIGRYIHLDAIDAFDIPFHKIRLNHLDLAINVYKGEKISERMNSSLASGGVVTDASYRTHIIRIDNIMFSDLLEIARLFFKSETMAEEWIETQFEFMKK